MLKYEEELNRNRDWALAEGGLYFESRSAVHHSLFEFVARLDRLQIDYGIAGAVCLFFHGYRRFTQEINVLVSHESLKQIHSELIGDGYVANGPRSKFLRDCQRGVRIEFAIAGDRAGTGEMSALVFPEPTHVTERIEGVRCLNLRSIIELKLASGASTRGRLKDLGDVQEVIKTLLLDRQFADQLQLAVRSIYLQMWDEVERGRPRQILRCSTDIPADQIQCFDQLYGHIGVDDSLLNAMKMDGIQLDLDCKLDREVTLFTFDPKVAARYGLISENDFWPME